jgi:hypothetical protein
MRRGRQWWTCACPTESPGSDISEESIPFPAEDTEWLPLRRTPCDWDEEDLAMAAPPGWRAYFDLEDSEKDLLSRCPPGLARTPLISQSWFHLRLPVLLSTMAAQLLPAEAAALFECGLAGASVTPAAAAAEVVEEEASRD